MGRQANLQPDKVRHAAKRFVRRRFPLSRRVDRGLPLLGHALAPSTTVYHPILHVDNGYLVRMSNTLPYHAALELKHFLRQSKDLHVVLVLGRLAVTEEPFWRSLLCLFKITKRPRRKWTNCNRK